MKREMPWIGQSPELISGRHHRAIGKARLLLDFYVHQQTDIQGRVYYGKPITYRWIAKRILECPCVRTLKRYNEQLRRNGYIATKTVIHDGEAVGFMVTMRNQAKFRTSPEARPAFQIGLFNAPVQIPVQKTRNAPNDVVTVLSPGGDRSVPVKDLKKETGRERNEQNPRAVRASSSPAVNAQAKTQFDERHAWRQQQKARRILREIETLREIYVGAFGDSLLRRDAEIEKLYSEIRRTGWQDARAG